MQKYFIVKQVVIFRIRSCVERGYLMVRLDYLREKECPKVWKIDHAGLELPARGRNTRKATVKVRRNPPLQILPLIQNKF